MCPVLVHRYAPFLGLIWRRSSSQRDRLQTHVLSSSTQCEGIYLLGDEGWSLEGKAIPLDTGISGRA